MKDFRVKNVENIYSGRVVDLTVETIAFPDGKEMTRELVHHPGAVAIVPILSATEIIMIKQFRYSAEGEIWEIPAGTLEPNESPADCAHRELVEEIGYRAGKMESLGGFYTSPGFCNEYLHLFRATDLQSAEAHLDKDEQIEVHTMTLQQALQKIESGEIIDAKTIIGLLRIHQGSFQHI
jgi:ADP-ribose pyrophosphatase